MSAGKRRENLGHGAHLRGLDGTSIAIRIRKSRKWLKISELVITKLPLNLFHS